MLAFGGHLVRRVERSPCAHTRCLLLRSRCILQHLHWAEPAPRPERRTCGAHLVLVSQTRRRAHVAVLRPVVGLKGTSTNRLRRRVVIQAIASIIICSLAVSITGTWTQQSRSARDEMEQ